MGFWHLAETMGMVIIHDSGFQNFAYRSFAQTETLPENHFLKEGSNLANKGKTAKVGPTSMAPFANTMLREGGWQRGTRSEKSTPAAVSESAAVNTPTSLIMT